MEVILGGFASRSFGLVVVSSVAATAVVQSALGTEPAFNLVEEFTLVSNWEFGLYLGLGVVTGLVALAYVWMVYHTEERFERWSFPAWAKALLGGLTVGVMRSVVLTSSASDMRGSNWRSPELLASA
jgi:CIC family chloride channel protein